MVGFLSSGAIITLATKLDLAGEGAGFLYVGRDLMYHVSYSKPVPMDPRFQFVIEKPPQKSGGNPDLQHIYEGDDILLRSVGNGKYPRYVTNYGGNNYWEIIASEIEAKSNYRSEGQGSMEMFRIVGMDKDKAGGIVNMDGLHTYGFVNVRSLAWLSASKEGVRSSANAGPRESWFITDASGNVPDSSCVAPPAPPILATPEPLHIPTAHPSQFQLINQRERSLAISKDEKIGIGIGGVIILILLIVGVIYAIKKGKRPSTSTGK